VSFPRKRESSNDTVFWIPAFAGMTKEHTSWSTPSVTMKQYYVYILSSKRNGTLYISVTNDLIKRIYEHKNDLVDGFTKQYQVHSLVYFEIHTNINEAIKREKSMKKWLRKWKLELIEKNNPNWIDLYELLVNEKFPGFPLSRE